MFSLCIDINLIFIINDYKLQFNEIFDIFCWNVYHYKSNKQLCGAVEKLFDN